jgi:hypothetical protein
MIFHRGIPAEEYQPPHLQRRPFLLQRQCRQLRLRQQPRRHRDIARRRGFALGRCRVQLRAKAWPSGDLSSANKPGSNFLVANAYVVIRSKRNTSDRNNARTTPMTMMTAPMLRKPDANVLNAPRPATKDDISTAFTSPTQKISYIVGKWQIMNLLGRYKDRQGENFRLGQFHDDLIKNGSLPVSVIEWIFARRSERATTDNEIIG